jgi:hypothetical protein
VKAKNCLITFIVTIGLVFFNCVPNTGITETGMNVTATGTTEGISLRISNIPKYTVSLKVSFRNITANDQIKNQEYYIYFRDDKLTELKESGNLIWPFVKPGHEYVIKVYSRTDMKTIYREECSTNAIAEGGIYLINNPLLYFTNGNSSLVLSEMPVFSKEVSYSEKNYLHQGIFQYSICVNTDEKTGWGESDWSNELIFDSVFSMINQIKENFCKDVEFKGDLPVYADVLCVLKYGNLEWTARIAETEKIIISF